MKGQCPRPLDDGDPDFYNLILLLLAASKTQHKQFLGAPGRVRTCDLRLRRPMLFQLSYGRTSLLQPPKLAERTGLEPATSGVTGRHSDQLNYRSNSSKLPFASSTSFLPRLGVPTGIRTPVTAVKGQCPRPLDDGDPDFYNLFLLLLAAFENLTPQPTQFIGAPGRVRTCDLRLRRPMLFQLSYGRASLLQPPKLAERTGLEPATSGVTGRHSDQLNYRSKSSNSLLPFLQPWWRQAGSNRRPLACHASALPAELCPQNLSLQPHPAFCRLASPRGFEPRLLP